MTAAEIYESVTKHSMNAQRPRSKLNIQCTTDPRYHPRLRHLIPAEITKQLE